MRNTPASSRFGYFRSREDVDLYSIRHNRRWLVFSQQSTNTGMEYSAKPPLHLHPIDRLSLQAAGRLSRVRNVTQSELREAAGFFHESTSTPAADLQPCSTWLFSQKLSFLMVSL
eukprot:scpid32336/ scgid31034/ 